jgi:3-methylcrotonyl-CoA carboxylase alpha subunit/acetyl-CoA/propionyl-CoA carboxylase biotin carboxyl carrier protein
VQSAGLTAVAVWSDADADAPHVRAADVAVRLGPTPASASYLSIEAVLRAAAESGADAVHPGYGFLSERAAFAAACADAGLVFIGPSASVMELMGRKDAAREVAVRAGVPVLPSYELADVPNPAVPYPLLVKAAAGGGGKGMRIVREPADLAAAVASARREAAAAFGDDTVLLERFVERGRHVEVQVLGDTHGAVLHLYERDCSVQRRHQKVLEEAPAPALPGSLRARLLQAAVDLAHAVGYTGAGTVEFLVSGDEFYFLEMNTRLQVEHPVTEAVTGLDLVSLQLRVAAGEPLALSQDDISCTGHAVEARIYAEDPYAGFLPQAGTAGLVRWPRSARVDEALQSGQRVGTAYDPMLAKVVTHGADRESARMALVRALDDTVLLGLPTNVGFCRELAASQAYADAAVHTAWLDSDPAALALLRRPVAPDEVAPVAAWLLAQSLTQQHVQAPDHPFSAADGWRSAGPSAPVTLRLSAPALLGDSEPAPVQSWLVDPQAGTVSVDATTMSVRTLASQDDSPGWHRLQVGGRVVDVTVSVESGRVQMSRLGHVWQAYVPDPASAAATHAGGDQTVRAPMPGTVLAVRVQAGETVAAGQPVVVLEAMKMELSLPAPYAGTVAEVAITAGEQVALGAPLVVLSPPEDAAGALS